MPEPTPQRVEELFQRAADLPAAARAAFLERECAGDAALRRRVEALLDQLDRGTAFDAPISEGPGAVIDRYKLLQRIGEGGFGVVYMAEQQTPVVRKVALKIIKLGMDTKEVVARFEAERQALALMDHPGIARVLDGGATATGRPYFVMELVRGVSITEYCDVNNLPVRERLELFAEVCLAVQHAHQKGVIHRDIKPGNVLVTQADGRPVPKVIDFGIAKAMHGRLTEKTLFTEFRRFLGTPTYMSPEQAEMSALDVDTRTDIYSLGVLLYELLTGSPPFDARALLEQGFEAIRRVIQQQPPQRPSLRISTSGTASIAAHRRAELPQLSRLLEGDLDWIVMRALEKERTRRYSSASELAADVRRHLSDEPVLAGPPGTAYRVRKFLARNRGAVLFAGVLALALLGGILGTTAGMISARRHAELARESQIVAVEQRHHAERSRDEAAALASLARDEAQRTQAVTDFLVETLALADPEVVLDPDVTVRTLLDRAAERIGDVFADRPQAEIALRTTIGRAYASLSQPALAQQHLRRAVALADEHGGLDLLALYRLLWELTGVAFTNEAPDAYALAHRARVVGHDFVRTSQPALAAALDRFIAASDQADEAALDAAFPEVLARAAADLAPGDPCWLVLAESCMHASYALWYGPHEAKTEAYWEAALEVMRRELPPNHPQIGEVVSQLVGVLNRQGKLGRAEDTIREGLALLAAVYPEDAFAVAQARAMLGENLSAQGRFAEAEPLLLRSHADILATLPDDTTFYAVDSFGRVLRLYDGWGRPAQAAPYRAELTHTCATARWLMPWSIARLLFDADQHALRAALDALQETCGEPYTAPLGADDGPADELLLPRVQAAVAERRAVLADGSELASVVGRHLLAWAATLDAARAPASRRLLLEEAAATVLPAAERAPLDAAELLAWQAVSAAADGESALADERANRAETLVAGLAAPDNWFTALAKVRVADALAALGRQQAAEALLLPAHEVVRRQLGPGHATSRRVRARLHRLYADWGRPDDAAAFADG